jgi:hypothetical protein
MRKKKKQIFVYDKLGRITFYDIVDLDLTYEYVYCDESDINSNRECVIKSFNNNSNFKTIINQIFIDGKYIDLKKKEIGDTYEIITDYNRKGEVLSVNRMNKLKNTTFSKTYIRNKKGEAIIWFEKYNKQKNIGFKLNKNFI